MRQLIFTACLFVCSSVVAQTPADSCQCRLVLDQVIQKVEANYPGWFDKVNDRTRPVYQRLTDSLRTEARRTPAKTACLSLLKQYKNFFRDGHLSVSLVGTNPVVPSPVRRVALTDAQARKYLTDRRRKHNPIEGIWETPEHSYTMAIVPDPERPGSLVGIVLAAKNPKWTPGTVKLELTPTKTGVYKSAYTAADFTAYPATADQFGNLFTVSEYGVWVRLFPQKASVAELQAFSQKSDPIEFRQIDPQFTYIRVSSFNISKKDLDSLVAKNRPALNRTPNLIIDIRDNGGGSNSSFGILQQLMNTDNFQDVYSDTRVTPENMALEDSMYAQSRREGWGSDSLLDEWGKELAENRQHMGEMYRSPAQTIRFEAVLPYPKRVAVLMNETCYSSAEYFVFYAKQSRKTTLFGKHTGGVMDYGNVRKRALSCPDFSLRIPTTRSGWVDTKPIDTFGFQPDVPIPVTEKDWIRYVMNYYRKQPGAGQ